MIPAVFLRVAHWPVTENGKADAAALAALPIPAETSEKNAAPQDETERRICALFCEILHLDAAGRDTDFFQAGGTSLDVITFLSARDAYVGLSAAAFMRDPTPAGIAARLQEQTPQHLLQPLRETDGEEILVLVPFAGGSAEAFSALAAQLRRRRPQMTLTFLPFLHSEEECRMAAEEIAQYAGHRRVYFYGHCVGGAVALRVMQILEGEYLARVQALFSAAYMPAKGPRHIWHFTPDRILRKILSKAGSRMEELPPQTADRFLSDFRADAAASASLLRDMQGKCAARICVLVSERDLFTPHASNAEEIWARFTAGEVRVTRIDSPSHYFQSTMPSAVADWIIGGLEP